MNEALEDAIKEAYALAPSHVVVYETLEIRQDPVQSPIYMVRSRREIVATLEDSTTHTFEPVGFQLSLPPSNEEGFKSLNIAIDNIDQRVSDFINTAKSNPVPIEVRYRTFLNTDLSMPQMKAPLVLYLKEVQVSSVQVTGRATFMDLVNKKFPSEIYTRKMFPALG